MKQPVFGGLSYLAVNASDDGALSLFRANDDGSLTFRSTLQDLNEQGFSTVPFDLALTHVGGVPTAFYTAQGTNSVVAVTLNFPIALSYNGVQFDAAETFAGAFSVAPAGGLIEMTKKALYSQAPERFVVDRDNMHFIINGDADVTIDLEGFAYNITVEGTADSTVYGRGAASEDIQFGKGDDLGYGYAGDDTLSGGDAMDRLFGGVGEDELIGGAGSDRLYGGQDADQIYGGGAFDLIIGGQGSDLLAGGGGDDEIFGDRGNDEIRGGRGDDLLSGGRGADSIDGSDGRDTLRGNEGDDMLFGGDNADLLDGGIGRDLLYGGASGDSVYGGDDADSLFGGAGADFMLGGGGADRVKGGSGNDRLFGGAGADTLEGGNNADFIFADTGNDMVFGGTGNDTLAGNDGTDRLSGGAGADVFVFFIEGLGSDTVMDFENNVDRLLFDYTSQGFATAFQFVNALADEQGDHVVFDFGAGSVTIRNATISQLYNDVEDQLLF